MKKFIKIVSILIILILIIGTIPSFAATASASLKANSTSVRRENEFKVTLSASAADGINGISTDITYDNTVLELVSSAVTNTSQWSNLSGGTDIDIMAIPVDDVTSADIYVLTFKVLSSAAVGTTTTISTTSIEVDTYLEENATATVGAQSVSITVAPDPTDNTATPIKENSAATSSSQKSVQTIQNDKTTSNKNIAYTGLEDTLYIVLIALVVVSIVVFINYKKYKDI